MKVASPRSVVDSFEQQILDTLARAQLPEGLVTNSVIIPHVKFRNLPNEHDLLVFTEGKVYTLDGKALEPGSYRSFGSGQWEYSRDSLSWEPVTFMTHPEEVAFKKARVTESYLRTQLQADKSIPLPQVISVIVVPDDADVSGLAWNTTGTATAARLLLTRVSDLARCLDADHNANRQRRPTVDELADLFHVDRQCLTTTLPCYLSTHLRIDAKLDSTVRPVKRDVYRGFDEQLRRVVRVEVLPKYGGDQSAALRLRAFRSNLLVLQELQHDALLRLYGQYDTPMALILVTEFFNNHTLQDVIDERRLNWTDTRMLFKPVVELLCKAHKHKERIVHRHLDPSCILIESGGGFNEVRVQGFFGAVVGGYSTIGDTTDEDSNPYLAPERRDAQARHGELQDAYSVGRCICAAMTGDPSHFPPEKLVGSEIITILEGLTAYIPNDRRDAWDRLSALLAQQKE